MISSSSSSGTSSNATSEAGFSPAVSTSSAGFLPIVGAGKVDVEMEIGNEKSVCDILRKLEKNPFSAIPGGMMSDVERKKLNKMCLDNVSFLPSPFFSLVFLLTYWLNFISRTISFTS